MNSYKLALTLLTCFLLYFIPLQAFSDDLKKANKYYEQYDYKFAINIYEKILLKKPSLEVAQKLADCYRFINNTQQAEIAYARVLSYPVADPVNYKYFADALKQNEHFNEAKVNYLKYAELVPAKASEANQMASACDFAKNMAENPEQSLVIQNETSLNSEYSDFSPVKYNEGYVIVSDRIADSKDKEIYGWTGNPYLKLYAADYGQKEAVISLLTEEINNQYHNGPAVFTADGNGVYFTRTDINPDKKAKGIKIGVKRIYYAVKTDSNWGSPLLLTFNKDSKYSVQHPALSADGNTLYFASDMPGGFGGMDIYVSRKLENGEWQQAVNCGSEVNTPEDEVFPVTGSDGKLYFSSKGHPGMGGLDLFSAMKSGDLFANVTNLKSPINSSKDDFGILFFDLHSGFISSNRNGGNGLDDIYRFSGANVKKEIPVFVLNGSVIENQTGLPVSGVEILLHNKLTGAGSTLKSDVSGKFQYTLEKQSEYLVKVEDTRYLLIPEKHISTGTESSVQNADFLVDRIEMVKLNSIYYNFNKWNLRVDALPELKRLNQFLRTNTAIFIQLKSHTDSRGSVVYNQWLSQKRAESVINYLIKLGVNPMRLKGSGLGESELLNKCADGINCSDADHQMNRRTEFNVIK